VNSVNLVGRLTGNPELRRTDGDLTVANFQIAYNDPPKKSGEKGTAHFFRVVAWQKTADFIGQYLGKGRLVAISGRLQTRSWENKSGDKQTVVEIVAERVTPLDKSNGSESTSTSKPANYNKVVVDDDDIPF
jgi:single-strand DNA-binding protein